MVRQMINSPGVNESFSRETYHSPGGVFPHGCSGRSWIRNSKKFGILLGFMQQMVIWLVVWTPLKNMSSSIGMIIPNLWENKKWQPNHQPVISSGSNGIWSNYSIASPKEKMPKKLDTRKFWGHKKSNVHICSHVPHRSASHLWGYIVSIVYFLLYFSKPHWASTKRGQRTKI